MSSNVKVIFLGGLGEIGRNCALIEQDDKIVILDCGLMFPNPDMPGVDLVLPDLTYVKENQHKVVGCVLTHGHEDHTGALSFLLRDIDFVLPIYGSQLALGLAANRIDEAGLSDRCEFIAVSDGETLEIGPFKVEFIPVTHSVPHSFGLAFYTSQGVIFHTGDFKIDLNPVDGRLTDLGRMGAIASNHGVRLLLSDSTNAEEIGRSESESEVGKTLSRLFSISRDRRIVVTCFSSHIHRIQQVANVAVASGRRVFTLGRSMGKNVALARRLGLLYIPDDHIFDIDQVSKYPKEEVCIISTGSQGEPMSALSLMAAGENKWLKLEQDDLVIISADAIPGNETAVGNVIDGLYRRGASVVHPGIEKVHTSGHAKADELKMVLSIIKPAAFIPVHGEFRHLFNHTMLAREMGVPQENIFLAEDGDVVVISDSGVDYGGEVPAGYLYVDGVVGDVNRGVLRDRKVLSEEGVIVVIVTVDMKSGELVTGPEIITRGWIHADEAEGLIEEAKDEVRRTIADVTLQDALDMETLRRHVRTSLGKYVHKQTKRRPMIVPVVLEA
ncbi:MAG: ribonuclease J [Acidimicrobiaceae bacterium]|nr:ribonuclease J [Acidimicrobiaceae bacterium]